MEFKDFLKNKFIVFLQIQTGITLSMGVIGCINPPKTGVSHYLFFMPFVYAFFCVLPSFLAYSRKELSIRQVIIRKTIYLGLIELIVLLISYMAEALMNTFMCVAIMLTVVIIYTAIELIDYFILKSDTGAMTKKIQSIKASRPEEKRVE